MLVQFDRRTALKSGGAAAGLALLPARLFAQKTADPKLAALFDAIAEEMLVLSPETATQLGLDNGKRTALKSKYSLGGPQADARWAALARSMKARLTAIDATKLAGPDRTRYDTVLYAAERGIEGSAFQYGGKAAAGIFGGDSPYVVTQQGGAVGNVPEFLVTAHGIRTRADADAYLARLTGFARQIVQETADIRERAAIGVVPPSFIATNALGILKGFRATPVAEQRVVTNLAEKTKAAGIAGDWAAQATRIIEREVYPALDREIAAFTDTTARAPETAGVWRLPDGEAYYRHVLQLGTTTTMTPAEVHKMGLDQNAMLKDRIDGILKAQGMTKGTVGERIAALNKDPRQLFADTPAGKAQLIAYCNEKLAAARAILPQLSHLKLKADVLVKQVPADIQDGAALGYMNPAALDGSRPAIYYINLKSTSLWPKYQIATLTAHEGVPGHAWQFAYIAEHQADLPLISAMINLNAPVEGWALYAEQCVDEAGLYKDDPFSRIGFLQALQFRACRLVADTGLHAMRWTRQQTIDFLSSETGKPVNAMTSETDRYCASPGQACGYKVGHTEIVRLRDKAKADLGTRFDLAAYNDAVMTAGGVPLTVMGGVVDRYIARAKG